MQGNEIEKAFLDDQLVGCAAAAKAFEVSTTTIQDWLHKGLPYLVKGGRGRAWAFSRLAIEIWLAENDLQEHRFS